VAVVRFMSEKENHVLEQKLMLPGAKIANHSTFAVKKEEYHIAFNAIYFHVQSLNDLPIVGKNMDRI